MTARIEPASPPFAADITSQFDRLMKGQPPLRLFTTLARDPRLFQKFFSSGLLDKGNLTIRQREIVIHRTTALCRSAYEWGIHVTAFSKRAGLTDEQVQATVNGSATHACWRTSLRASPVDLGTLRRRAPFLSLYGCPHLICMPRSPQTIARRTP
ncbi:carboxymuconolactone decarboxylase family protein [Variovorax sp. HW608]|uniref:carboxymuconolactone decarboxylase family protein n=1 Tax=Variovorax sp. HW608 TaxID=1034889 RepID=UPI000B5AD629|nr:carboxymuconolactone decarboxylase family protein [Variovorax sp. HW608]